MNCSIQFTKPVRPALPKAKADRRDHWCHEKWFVFNLHWCSL